MLVILMSACLGNYLSLSCHELKFIKANRFQQNFERKPEKENQYELLNIN